MAVEGGNVAEVPLPTTQNATVSLGQVETRKAGQALQVRNAAEAGPQTQLTTLLQRVSVVPSRAGPQAN